MLVRILLFSFTFSFNLRVVFRRTFIRNSVMFWLRCSIPFVAKDKLFVDDILNVLGGL